MAVDQLPLAVLTPEDLCDAIGQIGRCVGAIELDADAFNLDSAGHLRAVTIVLRFSNENGPPPWNRLPAQSHRRSTCSHPCSYPPMPRKAETSSRREHRLLTCSAPPPDQSVRSASRICSMAPSAP